MTVRHYMAPAGYRLQEAIDNGWVIPAMCGELFEPGDAVMNHPRIDICRDCHAIQHRPGSRRPHYVYRCFDSSDDLIYVGCTNAPPKRLEGHRAGSWWWPQVAYVRNLVFDNRDVALAKEREAIRRERPRANVKGRWLKDDTRALWSAQDYLDLHHATVQAVRTTHGVYGTFTRQMLREIEVELQEKFGVAVLTKVGAA